MFWKGPLFTKKGFVDTCINLETCEFVDKTKEEDGILVPLFRNCHTHLGDTEARKSLPENLLFFARLKGYKSFFDLFRKLFLNVSNYSKNHSDLCS